MTAPIRNKDLQRERDSRIETNRLLATIALALDQIAGVLLREEGRKAELARHVLDRERLANMGTRNLSTYWRARASLLARYPELVSPSGEE